MKKNLNQNSKATWVTSKTGPKIGIKINFALKLDVIQFSGLFLWPLNFLFYFCSKIFHWLSFLSHSRLYSLSFLGASNAYSTFSKISKKSKKFTNLIFSFFPKFFFIIIIWNYFWIDSPEILILNVMVELVEWKVLWQKLLSRYCTYYCSQLLTPAFRYETFLS